jgi:hypothetical protein
MHSALAGIFFVYHRGHGENQNQRVQLLGDSCAISGQHLFNTVRSSVHSVSSVVKV